MPEQPDTLICCSVLQNSVGRILVYVQDQKLEENHHSAVLGKCDAPPRQASSAKVLRRPVRVDRLQIAAVTTGHDALHISTPFPPDSDDANAVVCVSVDHRLTGPLLERVFLAPHLQKVRVEGR